MLLFSADVKNGNGGNTALLGYSEFATSPVPVLAVDDITDSSIVVALVLIVP